jgi:hypothetical protein
MTVRTQLNPSPHTVKTGRKPETLAYLPLVGHKLFWMVLLDSATSDVLGFIPIDPF